MLMETDSNLIKSRPDSEGSLLDESLCETFLDHQGFGFGLAG